MGFVGVLLLLFAAIVVASASRQGFDGFVGAFTVVGLPALGLVLGTGWLRRRFERRRAERQIAEAQARIAAHEAELARLDEQQRQIDQQRWELLVSVFGPDNARLVLAGKPWDGATPDMIREAVGEPHDVATKVMKSKTREVWKYRDPMNDRRHAMKITFEDGVCVGWETS